MFEVETAERHARQGPEVGSEVWANDVANRAAMVVELTRGWDTRGRVESDLSKEEAYAKFLETERRAQELARQQRAKSEPPKPLVEAVAAPPPPPKLAKGKITGVAGPKLAEPRTKPPLVSSTDEVVLAENAPASNQEALLARVDL